MKKMIALVVILIVMNGCVKKTNVIETISPKNESNLTKITTDPSEDKSTLIKIFTNKSGDKDAPVIIIIGQPKCEICKTNEEVQLVINRIIDISEKLLLKVQMPNDEKIKLAKGIVNQIIFAVEDIEIGVKPQTAFNSFKVNLKEMMRLYGIDLQ